MRAMFIFAFSVFFSINLAAQEPAKPGILINVGDAKVKKSLLALPPFLHLGTPSTDPKLNRVGTELFNTVLNDLDVSSYFQFIAQSAFLEDTAKVGLRPAPGDPNGFNFANWKQIGAEFLIRAGYKIIKDTISFEVYAYHIPQTRLVLGKEYQGTTKDVRRLAHTFASELVEALTGKKGYFNSKIVVASDKAGKQWKEIYVMDWDSHNEKKITDHRSVAISPAWSPDGKTVAYTAYAYHPKAKVRNADLFLYEIYTGKRFLISSRPGINSGAAFSPDGKLIYLTLSQGGNPDIFSMNTDGENIKPITKGPSGAMNVEPAIHPNNNKIAFSSDRSGKPMIYIMDINGSNIKRVTFAGRYNASPSWSPDGKKLAFAGWDSGHFDIFIMNSDGTGLERLTSARKPNGKAANNEDPTFSPDGRQIMFISDRTGKKQIYIVNADGTNERRITSDSANYFKPKWSTVID